jgi:hypothetical protein
LNIYKALEILYLKKKEETMNPFIAGFLKLQETKTGNMFEAAKKLKGDQHKLDKNKNGMLDKDDFEKLRKEEKKSEGDTHEIEFADKPGQKFRAIGKAPEAEPTLRSEPIPRSAPSTEKPQDYNSITHDGPGKPKKSSSEKSKDIGSDGKPYETPVYPDDGDNQDVRKFQMGGIKGARADRATATKMSQSDFDKDNNDGRNTSLKTRIGGAKVAKTVGRALRSMKEEEQLEEARSKKMIAALDKYMTAYRSAKASGDKEAVVSSLENARKANPNSRNIKQQLARLKAMKIEEDVEFSAEELAHIELVLDEGRGRPPGSKNKPKEGTAAAVGAGTETNGRDPRQHIQVIAGQAAGGRNIEFNHNDGSKSTIGPALGRKIIDHLGSLKPADRQAAVNKMHNSAEHMKGM